MTLRNDGTPAGVAGDTGGYTHVSTGPIEAAAATPRKEGASRSLETRGVAMVADGPTTTTATENAAATAISTPAFKDAQPKRGKQASVRLRVGVEGAAPGNADVLRVYATNDTAV